MGKMIINHWILAPYFSTLVLNIDKYEFNISINMFPTFFADFQPLFSNHFSNIFSMRPQVDSPPKGLADCGSYGAMAGKAQ